MAEKTTLARMEANAKRLKRQRLRLMAVHVPEKLFNAYNVKLRRDRLTKRQVITAMVELYIQGGFDVKEKEDQADKK